MGEYSVVKMGSKVYGPTTLGPKSKIGGEVNNAILSGYCSKGHDGYLGNAVVGEWCNMGADSNNSNLKNTYAQVKMWDYAEQRFVKTGLQFCGLVLGDHSKTGINTMFNTGTVVGVSANIYGSNFPRNFVPSFSWGGALGFKTYTLSKAIETAELVTKRKNEDFTEEDRKIFEHIFEESSSFRKS
jgi:UDP-N-acetylglucosamine diphosphorylase/glucosamine-1-phosphate N-acetyltransferase